MALLTPKEFAEKIEIGYNNLATYFAPPRSKFVYSIVEGKKMVDTELPINAVFIKERFDAITKKNLKAGLPPPIKDPDPLPPKIAQKQQESGKNADIFEIKEDFEQKKLEKITQEVFILELKKSKMAGEMVPHALVQPIVFQCLQYIQTQQKIADEAFLNDVSHKYSLSIEDMAEYRGIFIKSRNNAITTASHMLINDLDNIMSLVKVKKDVGKEIKNENHRRPISI